MDNVDIEERLMIRDLVSLVLNDEVPSAHAGRISAERAQARRAAAARLAQRLLALEGGQPVPDPEPPAASFAPTADECCGRVIPIRTVGKPLVMVRHRPRQTVITFTAALANAHRIPQFGFASIEAKDGAVEFTFTNDPAFRGGTFTLGFNGGSSRVAGSAGRVLQVRRGALPLPDGSYAPSVAWEGGSLVVRISDPWV